MLSYDPDAKPEIPAEMIEEGRELGLHPVHFICDEPGAKVGDQTGVSFFALVPFLPSVGDRLRLEDGKTCEVKRVYWKVWGRRDTATNLEALFASPNVVAVLLSKDQTT